MGTGKSLPKKNLVYFTFISFSSKNFYCFLSYAGTSRCVPGCHGSRAENKAKVRCCGWARIKLRNINVLWKPLWGQEGDNTRLIVFAKPPSDFAAVSPALVQTLPAVISQPGLSLPALPRALQGIRARGFAGMNGTGVFQLALRSSTLNGVIFLL